jgi:hypothetical protein
MHQTVEPVVFCGVCREKIDPKSGQFFRINLSDGEEDCFRQWNLKSDDPELNTKKTNIRFNSKSKKGCCAFDTACPKCIKKLLHDDILCFRE